MRSIAETLTKETLDPDELLLIEYSAVPFDNVLQSMPAGLSETLRGRVSDEKSAQGRYGDSLYTLMRFRVTRADLQTLAGALEMHEETSRESPAVKGWARYDFRRQSQSAPGWFAEWNAAEPLVAGDAWGATYEFRFLGVKGPEGQITVFAEFVSWAEPLGHVPSTIVWEDQAGTINGDRR